MTFGRGSSDLLCPTWGESAAALTAALTRGTHIALTWAPADHPVPLVLGGEPLPVQPGVLCASCKARKGLGQRRR